MTPGQADRFRMKPVTVEAVRWTGDNADEVYELTGCDNFDVLDEQDRLNCDDPEATATVFGNLHSTWTLVYTGQWIIKGVRGEFFRLADDLFREAYEPAAQDAPADGITPEYAAYEAYAMAAPDDLNFAEWEHVPAWQKRAIASAVQAGYEQRARQDARPAPELLHVATLGLDACATPGAVYTTHITDTGLTAEVDFGCNLNLDTDAAEELETAVHTGLELALAPHWGEGEWPDPENPVTGRTPGGAAPELAAERDGLRKSLHAIELGIAEPSPKWVAGEALNGRYFDPETDSGVWSTADPAAAVRAAMAETARLRDLAAEILSEVKLGTLGQHNAAATTRTLTRTAEFRKRAGLESP